MPKTAYYANGAGGQRTFVIPSHNLVVVRMGHFRGDRAGMKALNAALDQLLAAVPPASPSRAEGQPIL
jgi:CubicO group peptidase (beta-lactamase class C family)